MLKMTVAQRREKALERFNNEYIHDMETARHIINCFYRLAGLSERNCYNANNERTCNTRWHLENEEREERAIARLNKKLQPYGLELHVSIYPSICKRVNEYGAISVVYDSVFYN